MISRNKWTVEKTHAIQTFMSQVPHLTPHGSYLQAHLLFPSILFSQTSGPQKDFVKTHTEGGLLLSHWSTCSKRQKCGKWLKCGYFGLEIIEYVKGISTNSMRTCKSATLNVIWYCRCTSYRCPIIQKRKTYRPTNVESYLRQWKDFGAKSIKISPHPTHNLRHYCQISWTS